MGTAPLGLAFQAVLGISGQKNINTGEGSGVFTLLRAGRIWRGGELGLDTVPTDSFWLQCSVVNTNKLAGSVQFSVQHSLAAILGPAAHSCPAWQ